MSKIIILILAFCMCVSPALADYCYQESANVSNQTGVDLCTNLSYGGSYGAVAGAGSGQIYINYSKPSFNVSDAIVQIKFGANVAPSLLNVTADSTCLSQDVLMLKVDWFDVILSCYNGTSWSNLTGTMGTESYLGGGSGGNEYKLWDGNWDTYTQYNDGNSWWGNEQESGYYVSMFEEGIFWNPQVPACVYNTVQCFGDNIGVCDGSGWVNGTCQFGCNSNALRCYGGLEITTTSAGEGLGGLLSAITMPLGNFLMLLGAIAGMLGIVYAIAYTIRDVFH
jgi:hypothetical protein